MTKLVLAIMRTIGIPLELKEFRVFVSYQNDDRDTALNLVNVIENEWELPFKPLDPVTGECPKISALLLDVEKEIPLSTEIHTKIRESISIIDLLVVVIGKNTNTSPWVGSEISLAMDRSKPTVGIILAGSGYINEGNLPEGCPVIPMEYDDWKKRLNYMVHSVIHEKSQTNSSYLIYITLSLAMIVLALVNGSGFSLNILFPIACVVLIFYGSKRSFLMNWKKGEKFKGIKHINIQSYNSMHKYSLTKPSSGRAKGARR